MKKSIPNIGSDGARPTSNAPHVDKAIAALGGTQEVRLNVSIPSSLHRAVKMRSLEEGRTIREVVLTYLAEYSK